MTKLDDEAKAELLTFLVVGQLFAFARVGEWLRARQLIASAQMWLDSNGAACDWLERARLVEACRAVAIEALDLPFPQLEADLVQLFNLNRGWFLDYRKPIVQQIHALSVAHLSRGGLAAGNRRDPALPGHDAAGDPEDEKRGRPRAAP
ncbi:hypothetical protein [Paraburkholderia acidisoli]|uniref:Uncharacterized protein n=1 Tax=Paraburkholderia acidisoli TaxID=2571748 RepID=A0A7Z2JGG7_9BURK|nr:hypothetical protein [Paraburkholderia acidisoli]QGZ64582.1 hypothetical protein FAZ98_22330 [Paraburkholderia acidisoli]